LGSLPNVLAAPGPAPASPCVLELDGPMTPDRLDALRGAGANLLGYLPTNAFIADLSKSDLARLQALPWVRRAVAYQDQWKVAPELLLPQRAWTEPDRRSLAAAGVRVVSLWLFAERGPDATLASLAAAGAVTTSRELVAGTWCLTAHVPEGSVVGLATGADVQFAEEYSEFTTRSNAQVRAHVQSGTITATPFYDRGIHGEGQIAGIIDSRVNKDHCSFSDPEGDLPGPNHRKILAYNDTFGSVSHGTHVAGTLVGDGGTTGDTRGVAYLARFVYNTHPSASETSMFDRFNLHASQGARVHSNSWGADGVRSYDGPCRAIDAFLHDQEDNLIVHSVSNSSVVYNPENAKNSIAVSAAGGVGNENTMCVGGAGPTDDGRRKPEITSIGCNVASSNSSNACGTRFSTGTSMAAPGVSGAAILLRQYFTDGYFPSGSANPLDVFVPGGQLIKAMLVNGAVDMTGVPDFPNAREGWGRVQADNAAYFGGDARLLAIREVRNTDPRALSTGAEHTLLLGVGPGQPLKVTLSWADAPALANAAFAPVNNLDLIVEGPAGESFRGNVFAAGVSAPGGAADAINNLEQVLLPAASSGIWTVRVLGAAVNEGTQGYAIVVTGTVTDLTCPADFDLSGTADGDDVIAFFAAWDGASAASDMNRSGGVDGDDIIEFFTRWDAGC
ncbi:MAG: S8 family serine peptidase, partial [Phycisphaerales bacterium]